MTAPTVITATKMKSTTMEMSTAEKMAEAMVTPKGGAAGVTMMFPSTTVTRLSNPAS